MQRIKTEREREIEEEEEGPKIIIQVPSKNRK